MNRHDRKYFLMDWCDDCTVESTPRTFKELSSFVLISSLSGGGRA